MLLRAVWQKLTVSYVFAASIIRAIALMMEVASTSETPVNVYRTKRRKIPDDSDLQSRRSEKPKSHLQYVLHSIILVARLAF
jgi:hypothetical protein